MSGSGWLRRGDALGAAEKQIWNPIANLSGEELPERFLDLAVKALLAASGADRTGLWLVGNLLGLREAGRVAEAKPGPIPEQWKCVDFSLAFLHDALDSSFPILCGPGLPVAMPHFGPLVNMQKAAWLPIRAGRNPLGLAMVAYGDVQATIHLDRLCACAEEIAASLAAAQDRLRLNLASEEIRSHVRISSDILGDVPVRAVICQIVRAARLYLGAEFVAARIPGGASLFEMACDDADALRTEFELVLSSLWQSVEREGCVVELGGHELGALLTVPRSLSAEGVEKAIAVPIAVRNRICGVLMAGLRRNEDTSDTRARLALYAALAALALERENRNTEIAESKDSASKLLESSPECLLWVDSAGHIRAANRAAWELLRVPPFDDRSKRLEDFFEPAAREAVMQWRLELARPRAAKSNVVLEASLTPRDVVRLQFRALLAPREDGDSRSLIHLEALRPAKPLVESGGGLEAILLALIGAIDSGILLFDATGNIRMVSDRFAQIMGANSRQLFELRTGDALIDHLIGQFSRPAETAMRWRDRSQPGEETRRDELEMIWPTAKIIERLTRPLIGVDGQRVGWMEVYQDVTNERLVQGKLLQAEKMAALGQLVSGIAHELNNPLTSIQGYAQLLSTRKSAAERLSDAQRIALEAERAGGIVKNLLLFARETKPERRPTDLNDVVKRTLALRSYELSLENIFVHTELDPGLPRTLADGAQLQQVILNLIVNSEQAIRQRGGGGRIAIATRRVENARILLEISDDGPGIPPEVAARVFDPFFTTKAEGVGTGLGLSIVYGIVQEHGGEISLESVPNHGSTFKVELPVATSAAMPSSASSANALPAPLPINSKLTAMPFNIPSRVAPTTERILVIEDEPTVAQLIADVLTGEGYVVDVLMDSRDGLQRLQSSPYALAICDLKMPHLDGRAIFRELRCGESAMQNRLLFVTGDTMSPQTLEFLTSSGMPYLAKPFLVEELKQIVRNSIAPGTAALDAVAPPARSRDIGRRT